MKFLEFESMCKGAGLVATDCGNGHWRIVGKLQVNFYPFSRKRSLYINGATGRTTVNFATFQEAMEAATGKTRALVLFKNKTKRPGGNWSRRMKQLLLKKNDGCFYCNARLTINTITVDHKIPLVRGGSNNFDNLVGACQPCNQGKGHQL